MKNDIDINLIQQLFLNHIDKLEIVRGDIKKYIEDIIHSKNLSLQEDCRFLFLTQWDKILIVYYLQWLTVCRDLENPKPLENLFKLSDSGLLEVFKTRTTYTKTSFAIIFFSIFENFMRSIHRALLESNGKEKINKVFDDICETLDVSKNSNFYLALKSFRLARNTIHNNGLHKLPSVSLKYRNKDYKFIEGQPHSALGLEDIQWIVEDLFQGYKRIVEHKLIKAIPLIKDLGTDFYIVNNEIGNI